MGTQDRGLEPIRSLKDIEIDRMDFQTKFDTEKSTEERRILGQFATPYALANEIVSYAMSIVDETSISFLEPALGTGAIFSALLSNLKTPEQLQSAIGYEIDSDVGKVARDLWNDKTVVKVEDFTCALANKQSVNLLITNPPYVRHHLLSKEYKESLSHKSRSVSGRQLSGLSGLYCYFMLIAHQWLSQDAISAWLIPSEFMDVNYGTVIKSYLLNDVKLLRIHRYNPHDAMFDDATVSSCVVWFKNERCNEDYEVEFSYGGDHSNPGISKRIRKSVLLVEKKWTRFPEKDSRVSNRNAAKLRDLFSIKRGIATGDNSLFILNEEQVDRLGLRLDYLQPILPSPRKLTTDQIESDHKGCPRLREKHYLVNCQLNENELKNRYPELWVYLETGVGTTSEKYLCRSRRNWYFQEQRKPAPILCTYMGRNVMQSERPFRFILNHSRAIATNSFLMLYPTKELQEIIDAKPTIVRYIWEYLNSLSLDTLESDSRIYGGGLRKIEPSELGEIECSALIEVIFAGNCIFKKPEQLQMQLVQALGHRSFLRSAARRSAVTGAWQVPTRYNHIYVNQMGNSQCNTAKTPCLTAIQILSPTYGFWIIRALMIICWLFRVSARLGLRQRQIAQTGKCTSVGRRNGTHKGTRFRIQLLQSIVENNHIYVNQMWDSLCNMDNIQCLAVVRVSYAPPASNPPEYGGFLLCSWAISHNFRLLAETFLSV